MATIARPCQHQTVDLLFIELRDGKRAVAKFASPELGTKLQREYRYFSDTKISLQHSV